MAQIPAGCFNMGDHFGEGGYDELPVHNVCISAFEMDMHEVTNAEYAVCVGAGECTPPTDSSSSTRSSYYGNPDYDEYPIISVDWFQATQYCTWANKRLPTEAEWEYAARGGLAGKRFPWGDTINCDNACWGRGQMPFPPDFPGSPCWDYCHNDMCANDTHRVGGYAPNGYGLYDMAGNVSEWVNDWYGGQESDPPYNNIYYQDCYDQGTVYDPLGAANGTERVVRVGAWFEDANNMRVAGHADPPPDLVRSYVGFRCAR
jgi:formylglycine-generating enzyme required for sulfatase activity